MVAVTLVPVADAIGFALLKVQFTPGCGSTIAQVSVTLPVKPFTPFTTRVSVTLLPTLVATVARLAVTVKSFTESVTLVERVMPSPAFVPEIATVEFAAGVVPKVVCRVTTDWFSGVTPGVTVGGFGVHVTPAGSAPHPTVMGWF